jgi:hypothetical protein
MNHMPTRNVKEISSSTSGKMSCVSRSKNSRYVNRSGKRTGPISQSPTIPAQHLLRMWSDVLPLELCVDLHVPRYARYGN